MTATSWLGVDLGTQGVRATLVRDDGVPIGSGTYEFIHRNERDGSMTHDPATDWTIGTVSAIRDAVSNANRLDVAGIGISGLFPAVALVDADGRQIGPALLYGDARARGLVAETGRRLGVSLSGDEVSPRLAWLRQERPADLDRAAWALGPTGFLVHLLTGSATIDPHSAFRWGGLVGDSRRDWNVAALVDLGIRPEILPAILPPGDTAGVLTREAASSIGLCEGTPVIVGTTDSMATFLGHGAVHEGDVVVYYGSSGTLMACTVDLETALLDPSVIDEGVPWTLAAYALDSGRLLERLRATLLGKRSYAELDEAAANVAPGSNGVALVPHVRGRFDGHRLRPSIAFLAGFGLSDGPAEIWRAALESFGHVVADGCDRLPRFRGRVVAAGGGARSEVWRQIVSEISGLDQQFDPRGSAALGAAFLAAYGLGRVSRLDPVAEGWLREGRGANPISSPDAITAYAAERAAWHVFEAAADDPAREVPG